MRDELKPDTGGLAYLKPETGEPTGARAEVRPALTPEEWDGLVADFDAGFGIYRDPSEGDRVELFLSNGDGTLAAKIALDGEEAHKLAALALHGQPFGPKREWVRALRESVYGGEITPEVAEAMARFIEALLPPEGTQ